MPERQFGSTDLRVSPLGLGCNNFGVRLDPAAARGIVHAALDAGITVFDTADIYGKRGGSESILGEALGFRRKDVVLVTKFGLAMDEEGQLKGGSARYIATAIEASLKRLRDRLDRSLLSAPARSDDADRGDVARAGRARCAGQGALHRVFEYVCCTDRGSATRSRRQTVCAVLSCARINTICCRVRSRPKLFRRWKRIILRWCLTSRSRAAC